MVMDAGESKMTGLEPWPVRRQGMTWKDLLKAHWDVLAATDFFRGVDDTSGTEPDRSLETEWTLRNNLDGS
jgi:hypothetical protein